MLSQLAMGSLVLCSLGDVGIKYAFKRPYGGFLALFGAGNGRTPPYRIHEAVDNLGYV